MGGFLVELGTKLVERWLSLLVIPGLFYVGVVVASHTLGHLHPFDFGRITRQIDAWTTSPGVISTSGLVLILIATVLAAAGAGVTAPGAGIAHRADVARRPLAVLVAAAPPPRRVPHYHLDLATVWPNLWLAMPEATRTEITAAWESLARATTLAGWGLLYLVVGALWWPGLLIAVSIVGTACRRASTDTYALLVEAAGPLHTAELTRSLGVDHTGPLNQQTGWALTYLLQSHLIPLTTGWPTSP